MQRIALGLSIAVAISPRPGVAQTPDAIPPPTFHMVRPPAPGTTRFITVQIDPVEQAARLAAPPTPAPAMTPAPDVVAGLPPVAPLPTGSARYGWYWDSVSPALDDRSGRFAKALAALTLGPDGQSVAAPRLADMQQIATSYGKEILAATIGTQVSPALALAVIGIESKGNPKAVSSTGAQGLMQLIPATASRFRVGDVFDPAQNIKGGVTYLDWLMKTFDSDPVMVLAAYNAGENAVKSAGGVPAFAETRDYVPKVLAAWTVAQGLCLTPPELVSDGCVFRTAAN
jgi:soluble lytic murein transglycosylase-like protein